MKWGSDLTGWSPETIGYIVSNLAFFGALTMVYLIVSMDFSPSVAHRTLWAVALFPTSFFFTAVYTESLFLLLAVSALYAARRRMWWLAGLIGLLAALTRSAGVMLLAPFAVLFIQQHGWDIRRWFPNAIPAALPALGPVLFGWILTRHDMTFFDWVNQQWQWNRFSAMPWKTFDCTFNGCTAEVRSFGNTIEAQVSPVDWGWIGELLRHPSWNLFTSADFRYRVGQSQVFDVIVILGAIVLVLIGLKRLPLYYTAFVVPPLVVPLFSPSSVFPLMSMPRFVLPLFPLFVMIALLIPNRRVGLVLAGVSTVLLILLTMQFAQWYWVA
ncbi:MAG TPA: mannosyltransferase family protein [Thermomicrobiales bacterium]|nr:mannosyltransferase family protein [Thermomicrobiales bacterium]